MAAILYPLYSLAFIGLLVWAIFLWFTQRSTALIILMATLAALLYDNVVITIGSLIGEGDLLLALNNGRYLIHALVTPLLIFAALNQAQRLGIRTAGKRGVQIAAAIGILLLIGLGLADFANDTLTPVWFMDTLRYASEGGGPPIPAIITIVVLMALGIAIWRQAGWPWLFAGSLIMFIGSAVPSSVAGPVVGSGAEIVLLAALLATEKQTQQQTAVTAATV
jgi:hypothetical protein